MCCKKIVSSLAILFATLIAFTARADVSFTNITVGITVTDLGEAITWYKKIIGDKPKIEPYPGIVEYEVVKGFFLQLNEAPNVNPGDSDINFGVTDIEAEKDRLAKEGVDIGPINRIEGVVAYSQFKDPYGNKLSMNQVLAEK